MDLSAAAILDITKAGDLFTGSADEMKIQYSNLAKQWHPDVHKNSTVSHQVMTHVNGLYQRAVESLLSGIVEAANKIILQGKHGKRYEVNFVISSPFELGEMYIGKTVILYLFNKEHRSFWELAQENMKSFRYANETMEKEFSHYLPNMVDSFAAADGRFGLVIAKTSDLLLLKDVLHYYKGNIPERHVAWILSTLYNLACYFSYRNISHNGITLNNYFISPLYHRGALLGGWWYSVPLNEKLVGISSDTYAILPPDIKAAKQGAVATDLESIRLIARQLVGDKTGSSLTSRKDIAAPLVEWFRGVSGTTAFEEYSNWDKSLWRAYGEKKFVVMDVNQDTIYPK